MKKKINFGLTGAAGYIAPRHMKAIRDTGNNLVAMLDPNDSVGVIDSYFPNADFYTEPERFDRHMDMLRKKGDDFKIDYLSICTPNYLHDAHIRMALRNNAHAICEKPIVLNPWDVDALLDIQKEKEKNIYTILQLRLHPSIIALKEKIDKGPKDKIYDIDLTYITSRGQWYFISWKGDIKKSGSIATSIGVHFFDMLSWIFGPVTQNLVHVYEDDRAGGFLQLKNARVRWFLSVNSDYLPEDVKEKGQSTFRSITVEGEEIEFSGGFTDLHTRSYEDIICGGGFNLEDALQSIEIVHDIRHKHPVTIKNDYHPMIQKAK
jgi:UDP-N-acetyl-2-amino-2-deoxyglucuronate dehydrogenase